MHTENVPTNATSPANPSALPDAWIEKLFQRMEDRYGDLWSQRYGSFPRERVKRTWAEDLGDLTGAEIAAGVAACRSAKFPPTLPEFREMCRPPVDFEAAFAEAVEQTRLRDQGRDRWSSPAIFWAASTIGAFDLRNATWNSIRHRWMSVLGKELAKGAWPDIPERAVALPAPGQTMTAAGREIASEASRATSRGLDFDHLEWAKHPSSRIAVSVVVETARRDARFQQILADLTAQWVVGSDGQAVKLWDRTEKQWVKA